MREAIMIVLSLCGIDGSGKTTLAKILSKLLQHKYRRVKIVWFRWRALITYILYLYSKIRGYTIRIYNPRINASVTIHKWDRDPVLRSLYPYFLITDMLLCYTLNVFIAKVRRVEILIFDRFFIDAIVDIIYETKKLSVLRSIPSSIVYSLAKKVHCFILDVPPKIAWQRKKDLLFVREISYRRIIYRTLATLLDLPILDGTLHPKALYKIILNVIVKNH